MSVKVAVRVRPFNNRQINLGCSLCVDMEGKTTRLLDFGQQKKAKQFAFDYSFWSHDQFEIQEDGYSRPLSTKYADQKFVYDSVGREILDNAWEGYHCCLFAYGQTGSGKSYSMIGYGANSGIVPISCQKIFQRIGSNQDQNKEFELQISMMEIYNEKVQDLLVPVSKRSKQGLKIRQHKTQGVYVQGLTKHYVNTYQSIKSKMEEGNTHRSVAATEMNASSSRAHTIISLEFRQKQTLYDKKVEKLSVIHLVDLAGSERVQKTGAEGTRLKQAAGINKSLSVLGLVISNLADKAMGKGKNTVIPYRDSCLTRILQNALGGNSKTLMICAISPASDNYDETLSTLRYADQAKKIQNKAVINENQTDKMIRELTQENQKLKKMMQLFNKMGIDLMDEATLQRFYEAKSQLHFNNQMMKGYTMTVQQKQLANEIVSQFDQKQPHLVNLNQDPMLSRKVKYPMGEKNLSIGRKQADPSNDIIIGGVGILTHHAIIFKCEDQYFFKPLIDDKDTKCYINGTLVTQKTRLFDQDRLICGTNSTFLIFISGQARQGVEIIIQIDWEYAQDELFQHRKKQMNEHQGKKAQKQKIRESIMSKELQFEKMQLKKQNQAQILELKNQNIIEQEKYKEQFEKLKAEIQIEKQRLKQISEEEKKKSQQKDHFERKLAKEIPMLTQINQIAKQFNRDVYLIPKIVLMSEIQRQKNHSNTNKALRIKVINRQVGYDYYWSIQKFHQRYYQIKDLWQSYLETEQILQLNKENDPFWDPPEDTHICYGYITMMNLPYLLDNEAVLSLVDQNGECGKLTVSLTPTDDTGTINLGVEKDQQEECDEDDDYEESILGKPFYFAIEIKNARIPQNFTQIFVEYSIKLDENQKQIFRTERVNPLSTKIDFGYKYLHKVYNMTESIREYFKNTNLCLDFYGMIKAKPTAHVEETSNKQNENKGMKNADDLLQKLLEQIPKRKPNIKRDDGCTLI